MYQIRKFHGFLWASGGCYSDFLIHNIDECCWMKDAWPVKAKGTGGRHYRGDYDRSELRHLLGRIHLRRRHEAVPRRPQHRRLRPRVRQLRPRHQGLGGHLDLVPLAGQVPHLQGPEDGQEEPRLGVPAARAQPLPARMGRPDRRHPQGQALQRGQARAPRPAWSPRWAAWPPTPARSSPSTRCSNCAHEFAPDVDKLTMDGPAPLQAGPNGKYPMPEPGIKRDREY